MPSSGTKASAPPSRWETEPLVEIVAERLNRACCGMEIEPRYVDVIRRRWAEFVEGAGCDWAAATAALS